MARLDDHGPFQERRSVIPIQLPTPVFDTRFVQTLQAGFSSNVYNKDKTSSNLLTMQASGYSTTDHVYTFQ